MWVTKHLISPVKKRIFCPKTTKVGIFGQFGPGHAGLFGALLAGRLVVVARGLYLARHLFTLYIILLKAWRLPTHLRTSILQIKIFSCDNCILVHINQSLKVGN